VINNNPLPLQQALDLIYLKFLDSRIRIDLIAAMLTVADIREQDIALIIQVLREDGDRALTAASGKGKEPEGLETDLQIAIKIPLEEIKKLGRFSSNLRLARSMQQAISSDRDALLQAQHEKQVAQGDREMLLELSNGLRNGGSSPNICKAPTNNDDFIEKLSYLYVTGINDAATNDKCNKDGGIILDG
jgi:hypothetical protein